MNKGRKHTSAVLKNLSFLHFAGRLSAASMLAFSQIPAFYSCAAKDSAGEGAQETRHLVSLNAPMPAQLDIFTFHTDEPYYLDSFQRAEVISGYVFALRSRGPRYCAAMSASGDIYSRYWINNMEDLGDIRFLLEEDNPDNPFLFGFARVTEAGDMVISPALCCIKINTVSFGFKGGNPQGLVNALYLINACCEYAPFGAGGDGYPVSWTNLSEVCDYSPYIYSNENATVEDRMVFNRAFYTYPGVGDTRVVVEAVLDGTHCYYPITLNDMKPGKTYALDLTLTRLGTDSPDTPAESGTVIVKSSVAPWETMAPGTQYYQQGIQ